MLKEFFNSRNNDEINKYIDIATAILDIKHPVKYSHNGKYDNRYFITCLIDFLKNHTYWRRYKGTPDFPIKGTYLNQIHNKYSKSGVYNDIHKEFVLRYLKKNKSKKIKIQMTDTCFIQNQEGSVKSEYNNKLLPAYIKKQNKDIRKRNKAKKRRNRRKNKQNQEKMERENTLINFNKYNGRKKYVKVTSINNSFGCPLSPPFLVASKKSDSRVLKETIENLSIDLGTLKNSDNNRYKQYFLADSGYDTNHNKKYLKRRGYIPIIAYNKRNTKDEKIIAAKQLSKKHKEIYKKRRIIESFFSWIKKFPIINQVYQKKIVSHNGLLSLASSILVFRHT